MMDERPIGIGSKVYEVGWETSPFTTLFKADSMDEAKLLFLRRYNSARIGKVQAKLKEYKS